MRSTVTRAAVAISAKSIRLPRARQRATTNTILTPPPGASRVRASRPYSTKSPHFRIRAPLATELQVMKIILHIWRQRNSSDKGEMVRYEVPNVNHEMSFLEMLDVLNE